MNLGGLEKKLNKQILILGVFIFTMIHLRAQDFGQLEAGISYQIGGESTANYDAFYKVAYQKSLVTKSTLNLYSRTSYQSNLGPSYARAHVFDLTFGVNYFFTKKLFLIGDLGAMYWNESLAVDLPEIPSEIKISHPGIKLRAGVGYLLTNKIPVQLSTEFFGREASLLFLTFGYKFEK